MSVTDGDTIVVSLAGGTFDLRYIGIDTPETVAPGSPVGCFGPQASAANTSLVAGETVLLERDVSETDRYGRLLRYVWVEQPSGWLMVNRELVRLGYAQAATYPPDVRYADLFVADQRDAREAGRGLWGEVCTTPAPAARPPPGGNCDPSYPSVCIPPAPPDLDCPQITFRRFQVVPPDPHRFDGNHDGVGCESG